MCQAQRRRVAGPTWFAMPRSSPAGQGGGGTLSRCSFTGSAACSESGADSTAKKAIHLRLAVMGMIVEDVWRGCARPEVYRALACALGFVCAAAGASSDPLTALTTPGGAAIGLMTRVERSPY